jgi:hypothetical protein
MNKYNLPKPPRVKTHRVSDDSAGINLNVDRNSCPQLPDTWRRLVNVAQATGDISKISATYDALLKQYPNTACGGLVLFRFLFFCRSSLDLCSGFSSNPIYQSLFEH